MKSLVILLFICAALNGQHSDFRHINFQKADSIASQYKNATLKNLPVLTHNLTKSLTTDVEKFRAIYTWVCTNIKNDYSSYQRTIRKRKKLANDSLALIAWNNNYTPKVFENLLKHKKTTCTGYAYLIRELANLAHINTKIINGYGRTTTTIPNDKSIPNHSWNAVELNGKWYLCDPTWSAGRIYIDDEGPRFEPDYFDSYFLANPSLFIKNHYPLDSNWTLLKKAPSLKEFFAGPVVYREAFELKVTPNLPKLMHLNIAKNETLTFEFSANQSIDNEAIFLVLNNGASSKTIAPEITKNQNEYTVKDTFKNSGKFDVHIQVNDAIIATYVVRVKRN